MSYLNVIYYIYKIFESIKWLYGQVTSLIYKNNEQNHNDGLIELKNAKTEQEIKDALKKLANNP